MTLAIQERRGEERTDHRDDIYLHATLPETYRDECQGCLWGCGQGEH